MKASPLTLEEARARIYGQLPGRPGRAFIEGRCAYEVKRGDFDYRQCTMRSGYGPDDLYCKRHAKKVK